jgi:folate-binding protein YgfZ
VTQDDASDLLASGRAFADLSFWRTFSVSGPDAGAWLQDLVSADLADMASGGARPSLLLSPTGRIRAAFTVARVEEGWLLVQDPGQPRPVDVLLAPYVLSSAVAVEDRTEDLALFAWPGSVDEASRRAIEALAPGTGRILAPSCLGGGAGLDLLVPTAEHEHVGEALEARFTRAGNESVEAWRILAGIPRYGVDATEDDLPQEAGLDGAVAFDKGCYLGQEAVAKVRNLGHPRRLVLHLRGDGGVSAGDPVVTNGREAGSVTSAVPSDDGAVVFARVGWDVREGPFETPTGIRLSPVQTRRPV